MPPKTRSQRSAKEDTSPGLIYSSNAVLSICCSFWNTYVQSDCLLSDQQLKRLGEHKYSSQDSSFLDEFCMKRFWDWVVGQYPLWLAPNLITIIGLICNVVAVLCLASYSADAKQEAPRWAYVLCAVGLFIYQTLDATDGKQARRTGSASPLGELFDHGCDSATQVFICVEVCLSLQLGHTHGIILMTCAISIFVFYCAHWQTYCTGTLKFERFDVTEAQMCVIGLCLFTAVVGPQFWLIQVINGMPMNVIMVYATTFLAVFQSYWYVHTAMTGGVGKNGSTVADTSVLFPVFPILAVLIPHLMIYYKSSSGVFDENIVLFCFMFGIVGSKITNRLVISHMSKSPMELWDSIFCAPLLLILNQYFDTIVPELGLLYFCFVFALVNLLVMCVIVCRQFCWYLNIECFRITPKLAE